MIVARSIATAKERKTKLVMDALEMASASMASALAEMDGEVHIAMPAALEMVNVAVETESALKENATATLDGPDMHATSERACMTAPNMGIATMALVCAKKDIVDVIARFHPSPSHASVQFTVFVAACNNAPRCTRLRVLVHPMNVTLSAHRSVFPSA